MSDSVQPHRRQPTRLSCPWDPPGKNTGVGCHFLLQCIKVKVKLLSRAQLLATPWTAARQDPPPMGFSRQEYRSGLPYCLLRVLVGVSFFGVSLLSDHLPSLPSRPCSVHLTMYLCDHCAPLQSVCIPMLLLKSFTAT